jgi:hypothetical protein
MVVSLLLALAALRLGLQMRRLRLTGARPSAELRRRHLRVAKPAVAMLIAGFAAGPVSAVFLRGWSPFGSAHGFAGATAAALFLAVGILGRRLERGRGRPVEAHARVALLAMLTGGLAAVAGFVLLP